MASNVALPDSYKTPNHQTPKMKRSNASVGPDLEGSSMGFSMSGVTSATGAKLSGTKEIELFDNTGKSVARIKNKGNADPGLSFILNAVAEAADGDNGSTATLINYNVDTASFHGGRLEVTVSGNTGGGNISLGTGSGGDVWEDIICGDGKIEYGGRTGDELQVT